MKNLKASKRKRGAAVRSSDLVRRIRALERALGALCAWIERESNQHPSSYDQDATPHYAWTVLQQLPNDPSSLTPARP